MRIEALFFWALGARTARPHSVRSALILAFVRGIGAFSRFALSADESSTPRGLPARGPRPSALPAWTPVLPASCLFCLRRFVVDC